MEKEQKKTQSLMRQVQDLRIKHVRLLLALTRREGVTVDTFSPVYGMCLGEFATAYVFTRQRGNSVV
jgi:hypothetical protein